MNANERYLSIIERLHQPAVAERLIFTTPITSEMEAIEERLGVRLPETYKRLSSGLGAFTIRPKSARSSSRYDERFLAASLEGNDSIIAFTEEARMGDPPMPLHLVPFFVVTIGVGRDTMDILTCFNYTRLLDGEPTVIITGTTFRPRLAAESTKSYTFLDWLDRKVSELEQPHQIMPRMPADWDDADGWDRYWQETLKDTIWRDLEVAHFSHLAFREIDCLRAHGVQRVLLAGNGISLEGHVLALKGFDVTALDISATACQYVENFTPEPRRLARFLPDYELVDEDDGNRVHWFNMEKSIQRLERESRPGGCLRVTVGDMFTYSPDEPYDLVVSNRSIQAISPERRPVLAKRMWEWVRPGGFCIVETMNLCLKGHDVPLEDEFREAGFLKRTWTEETVQSAEDDNPGMPGPAPTAFDADHGRMSAGEKMVMFGHNSY